MARAPRHNAWSTASFGRVRSARVGLGAQVRADTDLARAPMRAVFSRAGCHEFARHVDYTWYAHHPAPLVSSPPPSCPPRLSARVRLASRRSTSSSGPFRCPLDPGRNAVEHGGQAEGEVLLGKVAAVFERAGEHRGPHAGI